MKYIKAFDTYKYSLCFCIIIQDTYRRRQMQRTITRQMSFDLTKLLVTEDWFSDISPQTMRRLLNIVSVTGKCDMITCSKNGIVFWLPVVTLRLLSV